MKEPKGRELIKRYKKNYHIRDNIAITEKMILGHWELEKLLTKELLESNSENRWQIFEKCYNRLYGELWWLNSISTDNIVPPFQRYRMWIDLIGKPPKRIYEIGSGKGEMIWYLATCGFDCTFTEISHERGQKHVAEHPNLSWSNSDGIHLDQFERCNSYDIVISDQVIEHLHPDELCNHFKGVLSILSNGGKYIFCTPHNYFGPSDISWVFKCNKPMGMHLREYTYQEIKELLELAGFKDIRAVFGTPLKISRIFGIYFKPKTSYSYMAYLCNIERLFSKLPQFLRRKLVKFLILILLFPNIFIIAKKTDMEKI